MKELEERDRDMLRRTSEGVPDIEVCREFKIDHSELERVLDRAAKRAEADDVADHAALYYERALRRRAENTCKSLQARFSALLEASSEAILVVNGVTGVIDQVNANAAKLFGYSAEDLVGRSMEDLVPQPLREVHPAYRRSFLISKRRREMGYHPPIFAVRADGSEIELAIALTSALSDGEVMVVCTEFARWSVLDVDDAEQTAQE